MMSDNKTINRKIWKIRKERGISQDEVAEALMMSTRQYRRIEGGHSNISIQFLTEFSKLFDMNPADFFEKSSSDNKQKILEEINQVLTKWQTEKLETLLKIMK